MATTKRAPKCVICGVDPIVGALAYVYALGRSSVLRADAEERSKMCSYHRRQVEDAERELADQPAPAADAALREVAEQAVTLYEIERARAVVEGDHQAENFWEGHRDTALQALGKLDEVDAVVEASLGLGRSAGAGA